MVSNKLRDLLRKARLFIECSPLMRVENNAGCLDRDKICAEIDAAISAPARNCDRFATSDEAWLEFKKTTPDAFFDTMGLSRFATWLFATAEEGENNGR